MFFEATGRWPARPAIRRRGRGWTQTLNSAWEPCRCERSCCAPTCALRDGIMADAFFRRVNVSDSQVFFGTLKRPPRSVAQWWAACPVSGRFCVWESPSSGPGCLSMSPRYNSSFPRPARSEGVVNGPICFFVPPLVFDTRTVVHE